MVRWKDHRSLAKDSRGFLLTKSEGALEISEFAVTLTGLDALGEKK